MKQIGEKGVSRGRTSNYSSLLKETSPIVGILGLGDNFGGVNRGSTHNWIDIIKNLSEGFDDMGKVVLDRVIQKGATTEHSHSDGDNAQQQEKSEDVLRKSSRFIHTSDFRYISFNLHPTHY